MTYCGMAGIIRSIRVIIMSFMTEITNKTFHPEEKKVMHFRISHAKEYMLPMQASNAHQYTHVGNWHLFSTCSPVLVHTITKKLGFDVSLFLLPEICVFGNQGCIFECNCQNGMCDAQTGDCINSTCKPGLPDNTSISKEFGWSGPGCQIGIKTIIHSQYALCYFAMTKAKLKPLLHNSCLPVVWKGLDGHA